MVLDQLLGAAHLLLPGDGRTANDATTNGWLHEQCRHEHNQARDPHQNPQATHRAEPFYLNAAAVGSSIAARSQPCQPSVQPHQPLQSRFCACRIY